MVKFQEKGLHTDKFSVRPLLSENWSGKGLLSDKFSVRSLVIYKLSLRPF